MKYQKSKKIKNQKKSWILIILSIFAFASITIIVLELTGVTNLYTRTNSEPETPQTEDSINYDPPTTEEANVGNLQKEKIVNQDTSQNTVPNTAEVVIVDANQYGDIVEVRAFVANIIKNGTCNYEFTLGNQSLVRQTSAIADASTTPCVNLEIARTDFPSAGTWSLKVTYDSSEITGTSTTEVVIE